MSVVRLARLAREGLERTQDRIQERVRRLPGQLEEMGETLVDRISNLPIVGRLTGRSVSPARPPQSSHRSSSISAHSQSPKSSQEAVALPDDINEQLDWDKAYIQVPLRKGSSLTQQDVEKAMSKRTSKNKPTKTPAKQRDESPTPNDDSSSYSGDFPLSTTYVPEYASRHETQPSKAGKPKIQSRTKEPPRRSKPVTRRKYTAKHETVPPPPPQASEPNVSAEASGRRGMTKSPLKPPSNDDASRHQNNAPRAQPPSPKALPERRAPAAPENPAPVTHHERSRAAPHHATEDPTRPTVLTHVAPLQGHAYRSPYDFEPPQMHYPSQLISHSRSPQAIHPPDRPASQPPAQWSAPFYGHTRVHPFVENSQTGQRAALPPFDVADSWARHGQRTWHGHDNWQSALDQERSRIRRMKEEATQQLQQLELKERQLLAELGGRKYPHIGGSMPPNMHMQPPRQPYQQNSHDAYAAMYDDAGYSGQEIPLLTLYPIGDRSRKVFSTNKRLTTNEVAPVAWKTVNLDGTSAPVMQIPHLLPAECVHNTLFN